MISPAKSRESRDVSDWENKDPGSRTKNNRIQIRYLISD